METLTKEQMAARLTGREYLEEITNEEEDIAKASGLLVVFGYSDDLMEIRGIARDEAGCCDGGTLLLDAKGFLPPWEEASEDEYSAEEYLHRKKAAKSIEAVWCGETGYSWTYKTAMPHATFEIVEDGEPYCRGLVIARDDILANAASEQQPEGGTRHAN